MASIKPMNTIRFALFLIVTTIGACLAAYLFAKYRILNTWVSVVKLIFYGLPVAFVFYSITKKNILPVIKMMNQKEAISAVIAYGVCLIIYPLIILTYCNSKFDKSKVTILQGTVSEKYVSRGKNMTSYYVKINKLEGINCCYKPSEFDSLKVNRDLYPEIIEQQSKVVLHVKEGFLNFPWLDFYQVKL